jgi:hypothetical protein
MNRNEPALHSPATEVRVEKKIAFGHPVGSYVPSD